VAHGDLDRSCAPACDPASWEGLPARHTAGIVLGAVGAAVTLAGVVVWAVSGRRPAPEVSRGPGRAGVAAAFRF
jgi:hypothetical protein